MKIKFYTIAAGERFERAATISKKSFERYGYDYRIIRPEGSYFAPDALKHNPFYNILFYKFAIAPCMLDADMYCYVDSDTFCMQELQLNRIQSGISAALDGMADIRVLQIENMRAGFMDIDFYFNSGVVFFDNEIKKILLTEYHDFVLERIKDMPLYGDQTWMNIFFASRYINRLGYFWNYKSDKPYARAFIWHAGGRGSKGIEAIEKYSKEIKL